MKWLAFAIYRSTQSRDYSSSLPLSLSHSLSLPFVLFHHERALSFFFHRRLQSVRDDLLRSWRRRPPSFFHPLNHPASTLSSRALNVCHPPSAHFPRSPFAHRHDYGIFFHPRVCPFGMSYPPPPPSLSRRTSSIFRNLVPASLRNPQTLDVYQQRRRGRTKDEITSGPITHAARVYL